ncbi:transcriptional regulator, GntR family [Pseudoflavonifractor capillosus ATCC 29799]|uniref:Transcriptional regulator, GntR family n=1 Tax=Pseudoflavonifractor capillosus ATCC 29799 TaxID=411467 RepID=A6P1H5_9FIRM|nr:GntR family transcriptional regulator [Pseudoflavonifractor capillosus]EDM97867.1 transcriptional regulator, GntR family [Pseudoflavonifractor capillosus ATCC 29799]
MDWNIEIKERLHQKLSDEILFHILDGEFPLGSKLPSKSVLIRDANTSQETLRKALMQLIAQKVLVKMRQGIYVTSDEQLLKSARQQYINREITKCQRALAKANCNANIQVEDEVY